MADISHLSTGKLKSRNFVIDDEQLTIIILALRATPDANLDVYDREQFDGLADMLQEAQDEDTANDVTPDGEDFANPITHDLT